MTKEIFPKEIEKACISMRKKAENGEIKNKQLENFILKYSDDISYKYLMWHIGALDEICHDEERRLEIFKMILEEHTKEVSIEEKNANVAFILKCTYEMEKSFNN